MIADDRSFVFVHIPKTAGTAIETSLAGFGEPVAGIDAWHDPARRPWHKHATAAIIRDGLGQDSFDRAFKFTFVRHPVDWVLSNYGGRAVHIPYREAMHARMPDVASLVRLVDIHNSLRDMPFAEWLPLWIEYARPSQRLMICDGDGKPMVDFVGKYENLEVDFAAICRRIGHPAARLPLINQTAERAAFSALEERDRRLIEEAFADDYDLFGYKTSDG